MGNSKLEYITINVFFHLLNNKIMKASKQHQSE